MELKARWASGVTAELPARCVPNIGKPNRIELVQYSHLAAGVPPLAREPGEAADLGGVDGGVGKDVCGDA